MVFPMKKVSMSRRAAAVALIRVAGGVSGLGDALLRPREVHLLADNDGAGSEALVERVVRAGSELRVELRLADGTTIWGQVSRDQAETLELRAGQILAVSLTGPPPSLAQAA
jgi:sulfate transport system ATP-binding protein